MAEQGTSFLSSRSSRTDDEQEGVRKGSLVPLRDGHGGGDEAESCLREQGLGEGHLEKALTSGSPPWGQQGRRQEESGLTEPRRAREPQGPRGGRDERGPRHLCGSLSLGHLLFQTRGQPLDLGSRCLASGPPKEEATASMPDAISSRASLSHGHVVRPRVCLPRPPNQSTTSDTSVQSRMEMRVPRRYWI